MIPNIFENPAVLRMGWALLHFLWQGTVIALALKGALMLVELRSSELRYALALASLILMAALPVLLLCKPQRDYSDIPAAYETVQFETASTTNATTTSIPIKNRPDFRATVLRFITPSIPWMAACWLLGVALLLLKTIGGIIQVQSLKRKAAAHCETQGIDTFRPLAARARVNGIRVLESKLVSTPTVAGWLKPVVLLPKGVLDKIDRPMLDALVAHEFAHVRRHDGVMNLFQTVIEDLLFFHPAMWWVSNSVRAEREACCDDAAVAICGDALVYVRALSQAEQFRSSIPVIALSSSPLLLRIRRLTEMRISKMNSVTAFCIALLAVSFIITTAAASISLAKIPPQDPKSNISANTQNAAFREDKKIAEPVSSTQPHQEGKYSLLCGIVGVKVDEATGKAVPFPPPQPAKDENDRLGGCFLFDVSTPGAHKMVPGELQASKLTYKVDPIYPESAIKGHVGIRVMLNINLSEEGLVKDTQVIKSQTVPPDRDSNGRWVGGVSAGVIKGINDAAINAVKQWKYSPTLLNGKAIPVKTTVVITFTFNKDGSPKIIAPLS
jgi:beta-lactamase regulating signal transducer with metallopeptidase domain